ncbi:HNH endonuclease signature motif containing protein [Burkholderia pseudomallei]|uniref:HNH endonuclease family protein n=1 Tax=Burkholderia pseudomallei TaxID=28450 RepID=A0AA40JIR2_BURPE|nr:HNH endonuclease signature motif containing protein [Burkholderia pseudomallei]KGS77562.1 HNH endonuclease family protein [Burkholderia pseudomallei MSHR5596]KGX17013.1 HNH endonuclease family protein [Burkholderia pseudomallei]
MTQRKPDSMRARRKKWLPPEVEYLRERYPHVKADLIARVLDMPVHMVHGKAAALGIRKSAEFYADACSGRFDGSRGANCRFPKGHVPWNKGTKGLQMGGEATQFKQGHRPANWMPIGSERYSKEGYLQRKMTDTGYPPRDWVAVHILLWEAEHGPVPAGHAVCFRDGDKSRIVIENLECIPRTDLMRRNSIHNLPAELKSVIRLKASVVRTINRRKA